MLKIGKYIIGAVVGIVGDIVAAVVLYLLERRSR